MDRIRQLSTLSLFVTLITTGSIATGVDHVTWKTERGEHQEQGRIIVTALDGGLLLESQDGVLWSVQPDQLIRHTTDDAPFQALDSNVLVERLRAEMPGDFSVHRTAHYTILFNTSPEYAKWCGALYERLFTGFYNYWKTRGMKLREPELPLVAIVFRDKATYVDLARRELADAADGIVGYYSLHTNRMYTYDLTGVDNGSKRQGTKTQGAHIQRILSQPQAVPLVATLIHEATHQLSYNSGLQSRYVENPIWLSEGLAIFFETPDLSSDRGWRTIGKVNDVRLQRFRQHLPSRPTGSLADLIERDDRLRTAETAVDGYAEAWAFCYYLLRVHPEAFVAYLRELSERPPLAEQPPELRRTIFERCFGKTIEAMEVDFLKYMLRLKQ